MCYDLSLTASIQEPANYFPEMIFSPQLELDFSPGDHIIRHGYPEYPIISRSPDGLQCRPMEWGVIPFYVKDEQAFLKQRASILNARGEKILDDPKSYWNKIKNRKCLIPVTGIFEHRGIVGWKNKVPYFIHLKDQPIFFLRCLYSTAELPDLSSGEIIKRYTFTLITRGANSLFTNIRRRILSV